MHRVLLRGVLLLALVIPQAASSRPANGQPIEFRCVVQSFSAKAGATSFFWKAVNKCDREIGVHTLLVELQVLDWSDWPDRVRWVHDRDIGELQDTFLDWFGRNGTIEVTPYFGIHCYRIYTVYAVLALQERVGDTASPGQCY